MHFYSEHTGIQESLRAFTDVKDCFNFLFSKLINNKVHRFISRIKYLPFHFVCCFCFAHFTVVLCWFSFFCCLIGGIGTPMPSTHTHMCVCVTLVYVCMCAQLKADYSIGIQNNNDIVGASSRRSHIAHSSSPLPYTLLCSYKFVALSFP